MKGNPPRILLINPFGIGDVLYSTPLVGALRGTYPDAFIAYVANRRASDVLRHNANVNKIFIYEKDEYGDLWKTSKIRCVKTFSHFLRQLKKENFTAAIDMSLSDKFGLVIMGLGIGKRVGFHYKKRGRFLTQKVDVPDGFAHKHIAEYYLDLGRSFGIKEDRVTPSEFPVSEPAYKAARELFERKGLRAGGIIVGIVPGGGDSWGASAVRKRWPVDKFAELAGGLIDEFEARIVLFGAASERQLCEKTEKAIKGGCANLAGETSLEEFAACISRCSLIVSNDGGPFHIAVSQNARTVGIFGPADPGIYGPYPARNTVRVISKDIPCRPCYKNFRLPSCDMHFECVTSIGVDEVCHACKELLQGHSCTKNATP
ncbi:MAG: lipopolysaccharide heptosyltransferase II [Candidatus Omnitrophica bacterium]|nr:lipopolysaccharide heptosyltransferase II [Candidatus Omnitrophota bacterium]